MQNIDLQAIIDTTVENLRSDFPIRPRVELRTLKRGGRANWTSQTISIPEWATKFGETYLIYYVLHELTHYYNGRLGGHGPKFREIENKLLSLWGITIRRAK